ncbi:hypothetical protein PV327_005773 [Microctonus hyperodae]|uniref:Beta-galactosidase n=2 Tax=Microctonus hyperodae TaxID=165561 RepID=A0AA39G2I5_MICHY|nr:hypothetical protein PV327_005773 [Microctonus hyperodae]
MLKFFTFTLVLIISSTSLTEQSNENRNDSKPVYGFEVDNEHNQFLLDGKSFRYVSGSFHYFRTPSVYWRDRLRKMRAAGLNAVSTYVEWSLHQPTPNTWRWTDEADIVGFLKIAQEEGLLVLLRPGPYICAERDLGGLPTWLMTLEPEIKMRTNDLRYMRYVEIYLNELLTRIKPLLRGNGGPIIMVQVENEYGSFHACDLAYKQKLRDIMTRHIESKALLYTTDGNTDGALRCGVISGVYATIDFGVSTNVQNNFNLMRRYQPTGPYVNSEYYSGWLTHWGEHFQTVQTQNFTKTLATMLSMNASVNIYMFYGGTNFGFSAGANGGDKYWPQITSYDYDAPLTEAGDPTEKYFAIRDTIGQFLPLPNLPLPTVAPKGDYGSILLKPVARFFDNETRSLFTTTMGVYNTPPTFEKLAIARGFVLYETNLPENMKDPAILRANIGDRGLVYVDDYLAGTLSRTLKINALVLQNPYAKRLSILVENQGHLNFGNIIEDWKGIFNVKIDDKPTVNTWKVTGFSMDDITPLNTSTSVISMKGNLINGPIFLRATFTIANEPLDTYLNTAGWGKGVAYVNGHNLGRYWPVIGPQVTLYIPAIFLKKGENEVIILELEYIATNLKMKFQTFADFGKSEIKQFPN